MYHATENRSSGIDHHAWKVLFVLLALGLVGCQTTSSSDKSAKQDGAATTKSDTTQPASPLAKQLHGDGSVAQERPSKETMQLAIGEYRWDEWKQMPLALKLDKSQTKAWEALQAQWDKKKEAGEDRTKLRAWLLGQLSDAQQQRWVRFVLYRSVYHRWRSKEVDEATLDKLWAAAKEPAMALLKQNALQTNPYLKNIKDTIDQLEAKVSG